VNSAASGRVVSGRTACGHPAAGVAARGAAAPELAICRRTGRGRVPPRGRPAAL